MNFYILYILLFNLFYTVMSENWNKNVVAKDFFATKINCQDKLD